MTQTGEENRHRLVSCQWLAQRLNDPNVRTIEVTASPDGESYRESHIPGAAWWFWKDALWHASDREFATPQEMAERLGSIGVGPETTVVLYGEPVQYGTYAFWVMTMAGHRDVRILDGGRKRWIADGLAMTAEKPSFESVGYPAAVADASSLLGRDDVRDHLSDPDRILLDVRSPEEFRGERVSPPPNFDHGAERTGRIPGAVPLFFREFLNDDDTFVDPTEARAKLAGVGISPDSPKEVVTYCRLSHRATLAWFAMTELVGIGDVKIYDGSWTEWGSIVGFPIEK